MLRSLDGRLAPEFGAQRPSCSLEHFSSQVLIVLINSRICVSLSKLILIASMVGSQKLRCPGLKRSPTSRRNTMQFNFTAFRHVFESKTNSELGWKIKRFALGPNGIKVVSVRLEKIIKLSQAVTFDRDTGWVQSFHRPEHFGEMQDSAGFNGTPSTPRTLKVSNDPKERIAFPGLDGLRCQIMARFSGNTILAYDCQLSRLRSIVFRFLKFLDSNMILYDLFKIS